MSYCKNDDAKSDSKIQNFNLNCNIPIVGEYDVIVAGGGPAGCTAAIQAAREGMRTALIEKNGILGGTTVTAAVNFPGLFHAWGRQVIAGIGWEAIEKTACLGGAQLPDFSVIPEKHWHHQIRVNRFIYSAVLDSMCVTAGVQLRLHEMPAIIVEDKEFLYVAVTGKTGLAAMKRKILVDATGDADVVGMMGYPREKGEYLQPGTLENSIIGYDLSQINWEELKKAYDESIKKGELLITDHMRGEIPFLSELKSGRLDMHIPNIDGSTSQGRTEAEIQARKTLLRVYEFLRNVPGCEKLSISHAGNECGIRETWRIQGEVKIDCDSYMSGYKWPDAVCYSFYPIDIHSHDSNTVEKRMISPGIVPMIPYRAMIPKGSNRVLAAGRCISGDREANSAYRVQATCMATGQVAGAAAAIAARKRISVREVDIDALRHILKTHGAIVP